MDDQRKVEVRQNNGPAKAAHEHIRVNVERPRPLKERSWPGSLMVLGIFAAIFTLGWTGRRTAVSAEFLARGLMLFCVIGTLVPYGWSGLRMGMAKLEWFLFNLLAVGPLTICALLLLNSWVHGPVIYERLHIGSDALIQVSEEDGSRRSILFPWPGSFEFGSDELGIGSSGQYRIGVAKGCLGYWVVVERRVAE